MARRAAEPGKRLSDADRYERDTRLAQMVERAGANRQRRKERYEWLRMWYTRGTDQAGPPARYNRLQSHVDQLSSYLYGPDGTRFSLSLPPRNRNRWMDHARVARDEFTRTWRDTGADVLFSQIVDSAIIYGTAFAKLTPYERYGVQVNYIPPGDLGVLREDVPELERQDVIVHWYYLSLPEVELLVRGLPEAEADAILDYARQRSVPAPEAGQSVRPNVVTQVIVANVQSSDISGVLSLGSLGDDRPDVNEPIVELAEVWERVEFVRKDKSGRRMGDPIPDYLVTTMIGPHAIIEPRRNTILPAVGAPYELPGELPIVKIATKPMRDYFWAISEIAGLVMLQDWREMRMIEIDELLKRNIKPPRFLSGVALMDEKLKALDSIGGYLAVPNPVAKIENLAPDIPDQAFTMLDRIDAMFAEQGGIPPILSGVNPPDVRAGSQLGTLAGIAAGGRIRKKALLVEDALEVLATRFFHLMQRRDPTPYPMHRPGEREQTFLLSQLPADIKVLVSAHSASPVYAEQLAQKAGALLQAGAIDLPTFVDFMNVPMSEELRVRAEALQEAKAATQEKLLRLELLKAERRYGKAPKEGGS